MSAKKLNLFKDISSDKANIKFLVFLFPLFLLASLYYLRVANYGFYKKIVSENHLLENSQFIFYFLGSLFGFTGVLFVYKKFSSSDFKIKTTLYLILLSALLFFLAFEEISWGQIWFNFRLPEAVKSANVQQELTVHNLDLFHTYLPLTTALSSFFLAFSWAALRLAHRLEISILNSRSVTKGILFPDWFLMTYFLPNGILNLHLQILRIRGKYMAFWGGRDSECTEFVFSLGLVFFTVLVFLRLQKWENAKLTS